MLGDLLVDAEIRAGRDVASASLGKWRCAFSQRLAVAASGVADDRHGRWSERPSAWGQVYGDHEDAKKGNTTSGWIC